MGSNRKTQTSTSSLNVSSGASMTFFSVNSSLSTSNGQLRSFSSLSQCRSFIDLLAIISSRGHVSLKSSIFCFNSMKAGQSFIPFGSLRHLLCDWLLKQYVVSQTPLCFIEVLLFHIIRAT